MSANRSVQAAQRRRAGPPEPQIPGRGGPQPSINSSQMFASQSRQGAGSNIPGRSSGQQNSMSEQTKEGSTAVSKLTVAQAITLITLRLGVVETKLQNIDTTNINNRSVSSDNFIEGQENMVLIDKYVIESITNRLESLEKRSASNISSSTNSSLNPELTLIKQQIETLKQVVVQTKNSSSNVTKENKDLKQQVELLNKEVGELKELINALQNLTMDNSQKLMSLSMNNDSFDIGNEELDNADLTVAENDAVENIEAESENIENE